MKHSITATVTAAIACVSLGALADEPDTKEPLPSTGTTAPAATSAPGAPTTVTSADSAGDVQGTVTPMPTAAARPQTAETVTLYNKVRPNKPWLVTGGLMLVGSYVTTAAITAASSNPNADQTLYVPIVGPWVHLADSAATATNSTTDTILVAGSGVLQGVGAGLALASLFIPERVPAATIEAGNTRIHFAPASFGVASAGIGAGGTF